MNYRGYTVEACTQMTQVGAQPAWKIAAGDQFKAYVGSRDFSKHVIDAKIQTGEWPDLKPKEDT